MARGATTIIVLLLGAAVGAVCALGLRPHADVQAATPMHRAVVPPRLVTDCRHPRLRPAQVVLTCADAGLTAQNVRWESWGGRVAVGYGSVLAHECTPDCASSNRYRAYPVVLVASHRVGCGAGDRRYTRVGYSWTAESPYPAGAAGSRNPFVAYGCGKA